MSDYNNPVQIASDPVIKTKVAKTTSFEYTPEEQTEADLVQTILDAREQYSKDRLNKEKEWTDSYKMFMSYLDIGRNPFLSNLFIPKTHEAVELLSAFLMGTNQSITAEPENNGDSQKALVAGKWLDWMWRKVIRARLKVLTWIKQGIVFGNGIIKVGWDDELKQPFMVNTAIEDVYFDYFEPAIQDSEYIIHEIRISKEKVSDDDRYNDLRKEVIVGGKSPYSSGIEYKFASYDKSLVQDHCENRVVICEAWCKKDNRIISIAPTGQGWRVLRNVENPNAYTGPDNKKVPFRPFSKLRFKTSPLANRAYDTGAVYPTVRIQKAFNDLINQYFDNVVLINNAMWVKRRGARINPTELIRRPGGVITVGDINADLRADVTPDIKQSLIEMLTRLDSEFQQASMVVNLLKGIDNGTQNTATEAQLGQQNVQTLLDLVDENIADALSEVGDMVLAIAIDNSEGLQSIKMFEDDKNIGILEFDPKEINGQRDVKIRADRSAGASKVVRQKQLLDFIMTIMRDPLIGQKYPTLVRKSLEKWLEEAGFSDTSYFFDESTALPTDAAAPVQPGVPGVPGVPGSSPGVPNVQSMLAQPGGIPTA